MTARTPHGADHKDCKEQRKDWELGCDLVFNFPPEIVLSSMGDSSVGF